MSNWPVPLVGPSEASGFASGTSVGLALTTSYQSLETATDYDWFGFLLGVGTRQTGADTDFSLALGASQTELLIDRMAVGSAGSTYGNWQYVFYPLRVPQGSQVSIKLGAAASNTYAHLIGLHGGNVINPAGSHLERLAAAGGVTIDGGASLNTKGAWASLGTTANAWNGLYASLVSGTGLTCDFLVDFAIDVGGTKYIIPGLGDLPIQKGSNASVRPNIVGPVGGNIPAGSAIYARCQCSSTTSTNRVLSANVHGIVT
jgi:hypothetical protein